MCNCSCKNRKPRTLSIAQKYVDVRSHCVRDATFGDKSNNAVKSPANACVVGGTNQLGDVVFYFKPEVSLALSHQFHVTKCLFTHITSMAIYKTVIEPSPGDAWNVPGSSSVILGTCCSTCNKHIGCTHV